MSHQLSNRDIEIIRFINEFGFCQIGHIMRRFSLKDKNAYKVLRRLCVDGLVIHERIFLRQAGAYYLSKDGAKHTDLKRIRQLPSNQYDHQLKIVDVYLQLRMRHQEATWIAERYLMRQRKHKNDHVSDGLLILPNDYKIAIEVELTLKDEKRISDIFAFYNTQFFIQEVWYYCKPELLNKLTRISTHSSMIKIYDIEELLK